MKTVPFTSLRSAAGDSDISVYPSRISKLISKFIVSASEAPPALFCQRGEHQFFFLVYLIFVFKQIKLFSGTIVGEQIRRRALEPCLPLS